MRAELPDEVERRRLTGRSEYATTAADGRNGVFFIEKASATLKVIASDGAGWADSGLSGLPWEHVSVSLPNRCPNWPEMSFVKDLFWEPEELVLQFHPPRSRYVSIHQFCLHLWKPPLEVALPPLETV